jgi:hypothetical protein
MSLVFMDCRHELSRVEQRRAKFAWDSLSLSNRERGSLTLSVSDADIIQPTKQTSASRVLKTQYEQKIIVLMVASICRNISCGLYCCAILQSRYFGAYP